MIGPTLFFVIAGASFALGCAFMGFIQAWDEAVHADPDAGKTWQPPWHELRDPQPISEQEGDDG